MHCTSHALIIIDIRHVYIRFLNSSCASNLQTDLEIVLGKHIMDAFHKKWKIYLMKSKIVGLMGVPISKTLFVESDTVETGVGGYRY